MFRRRKRVLMPVAAEVTPGAERGEAQTEKLGAECGKPDAFVAKQRRED